MDLYNDRIVVKVGTSSLTDENGKAILQSFDKIASALSIVGNMGYKVILVSSGAIAIGADSIKMKNSQQLLPMKQAAAAVGQCLLMNFYTRAFSNYSKTAAQILLSTDDIGCEIKRKNLANTFDSLFDMGIIPIVNENDSVSCDEIESSEKLFGDNDMLSANVAQLCRAKRLVILSDIDALYDSDPHVNPNAKAIDEVFDIDEKILSFAGSSGSRRGRGGMKTKLQAAKTAAQNGIDTVILNGRRPESILKILSGSKAGTLFHGVNL